MVELAVLTQRLARMNGCDGGLHFDSVEICIKKLYLTFLL